MFKHKLRHSREGGNLFGNQPIFDKHMFYMVFYEHQPDARLREDDEEVLNEQYYTIPGMTEFLLKRKILGEGCKLLKLTCSNKQLLITKHFRHF